jgi:hypothetical protein
MEIVSADRTATAYRLAEYSMLAGANIMKIHRIYL